MPACLSCWLAGYTVRAKHTHRNSCHPLDTREARVSHAPHAHSCSLKEAQVRAAKPPKPPVAPAVHPLRSRDGADAAAAAAALRRSPRTCRFRCYPPCLSKKDLLQLAVSPVHVNNFSNQKCRCVRWRRPGLWLGQLYTSIASQRFAYPGGRTVVCVRCGLSPRQARDGRSLCWHAGGGVVAAPIVRNLDAGPRLVQESRGGQCRGWLAPGRFAPAWQEL